MSERRSGEDRPGTRGVAQLAAAFVIDPQAHWHVNDATGKHIAICLGNDPERGQSARLIVDVLNAVR